MSKLITKDGPFIKDNNSTFKIMRNLFIALFPIILFSCYKNGYIPYKAGKIGISGLFYPLIFVMIPASTSFLAEVIWARLAIKKKGKELISYVTASFGIFPGLFLGLLLPINTPLAIVILGSLFATIIGKLVYGGFGKNIFNPALIGGLFIMTTYAVVIANNGGYLNKSEMDAVTTATPLSNIVEGIGTYDTLVKPYGSLKDFFIGTIPGAVGETSALLCLLGFLYLVFKKVIKWIIPVLYILTVFVITYVIGAINGAEIWYPLFQILSGGLMFGAVFMATDPVTSPVTKTGQIIYAIGLGLLTVVFRYLTPFPEGVLTSILTMNMLVCMLDKIGFKARFSKIYRIIPILIVMVITILTTIVIILNFDKPSSNFNILNKEVNDKQTTYIVTQKGYSSELKAEVVLESNKVISYKVLEQNDSFYKTIENNDYVKELVNNQNNLKDFDTIAGATITSTALKNLLINVINDYTNGKGFEKTEEKPIVKKDFEIISKIEDKNEIIYVVTQKSFGGKLKLEVTIVNEIIKKIDVLEHHDSYFDKIENANYIDLILTNANDLENLDAVSGATVSSTALKRAILEVIKDLNESKVDSNEGQD